MTAERATIARNLEVVRDRIARAGDVDGRVRLIAVTKGLSTDTVRAALDLGVVDIGESYVQELVRKAADLEGDDDRTAWPRWHLIGRLQRNKVRHAAPHTALWHSVDRLALGVQIARFAPGAAVMVQVNALGEEGKGGCSPAMVSGLVDGLRDLGLDVRGLMTVPPAGSAEQARPVFRLVRELGEQLGLPELSMGMSHDLEVAVEEGATMVRVGTALFGPRPAPPRMRH